MIRPWILLLTLAGPTLGQPALEHFEKQVRPVLARNCYGCHGVQKQFGALRVDGRDHLLKGGKSGAAVVPGKPAGSLLMKAVLHEGPKMPMGGKLTDSEIAALEKWVRDGAVWPAETPARAAAAASSHWAFQPVRDVTPPAGALNPVDGFLRAALLKKGLRFAPRADQATLLRRLSFVLTGLPPDPSLSALPYEAAVDKLLDSPHFGERWARHWMDLVRFAETYGYEWNYETLGAWHYRDYLIRAFSQDVPIDQLIREHIAGDLLAKPRHNAALGLNESLIGTMFFRLGEMGHDDCVEFREIRTDVVDNQIDTLTKAFQGLTVSCARCHDHKLDPIPTGDYYALYGILTSARQVARSIDLPEVHKATRDRLSALKPRLREEAARLWTEAAVTAPALSAQLGKDKRKLEDPLYLWQELTAHPDAIGATWRRLAGEYRKENQARAAFNRENFRPFADFRNGGFAGWHSEGAGLTGGATAAGEFAIAPGGDTAISGVFPSGVFTHSLSERLNGVLRSPFLPKDRKFASLELMGGKLGARRTIIDNCMLGEDYQVLTEPAPKWFKTSTSSKEKDLPVYLELATKFDNPRLPDRPDKIKGFQQEQLDSPGSYFGVTRVVLHDIDETPRDEMEPMLRLFEGAEPATLEDAARRYETILRQAAGSWRSGTASDSDAFWLGWFARMGLAPNSPNASPKLAALLEEYRGVESHLARPRVVNGMADLEPGYDMPVFRAGNPRSHGDIAPRRYLEILGGREPFRTMGSGRRELAELIASAKNPLTARVMVNRMWHYVFGRGIVPSVDNFGRFGDAPSHAELLDYLAGRFVKEGWSLKKLLRLMVTAEAFRQSSLPAANAAAADPGNVLLSHYPVRRLEAEAIRDAILLATGSLDRRRFGPSVQPHRDDPKEYRKLVSGPLDGAGRRSIYLKVTRMEGARFLDLFDFPAPAQTRGSRDITNVPPQALGMLNDPFVIGQAARWAETLVADGSSSAEARIEAMFRQALGRPPRPDETARFRGLAAELGSLEGVQAASLLSSAAVWKDVAHAILNLKEFIYLH